MQEPTLLLWDNRLSSLEKEMVAIKVVQDNILSKIIEIKNNIQHDKLIALEHTLVGIDGKNGLRSEVKTMTNDLKDIKKDITYYKGLVVGIIITFTLLQIILQLVTPFIQSLVK